MCCWYLQLCRASPPLYLCISAERLTRFVSASLIASRTERRPMASPGIPRPARRPIGPVGPVSGEGERHTSAIRLKLQAGPLDAGSLLQSLASVRMARRTCSGSFGQASTNRASSGGISGRCVQPVCNRGSCLSVSVCNTSSCKATYWDCRSGGCGFESRRPRLSISGCSVVGQWPRGNLPV